MNQASENRYHCLITVGTTQFPDLIKTIDDNASDLIKVLQNKGILNVFYFILQPKRLMMWMNIHIYLFFVLHH